MTDRYPITKTRVDGTWSSATAPESELRAILGDAIAEEILADRRSGIPHASWTVTGSGSFVLDDTDRPGPNRATRRRRDRGY